MRPLILMFLGEAYALADRLEDAREFAGSLGKLYRGRGTRGQARKHLTTAATLYRAMDMPFWLEQAEAEMPRAQ